MQQDFTLALQPNQIDVFLLDPSADYTAELLQQYRNLLSEPELQRLARYKYPEMERNGLLTRALVRTVLSQYCHQVGYVAPQDWQFVHGRHGKPEVKQPPLPIRFNLSHAEGLIVCAVAQQLDIGIDVEYIWRDNKLEQIARHKFAESEAEALFALPPLLQRSRFFDYWTLKEAYIKAVGDGMSIPLNKFYFDSPQQKPVQISFEPSMQQDSQQWQHWLFDATSEHRMGISINAPQQQQYQLRFIQTTPLVSQRQIQLSMALAKVRAMPDID